MRKTKQTWKSMVALFTCFAMILQPNINSPMKAQAETTTATTTFTFTEDGITADDAGDTNYKISGTTLTINGSGNYAVTGSCSNGQVKVKKATTDVNLTLTDLTLGNTYSAPVLCNKNTEVALIIQGTVTLNDTINNNEDYLVNKGYATYDSTTDVYSYTGTLDGTTSGDEAEAENAVIKLKSASKVTMTGTGTLSITAKAKNGIKSGAALDSDGNETTGSKAEACLSIDGPTLNIDATNVYKPDNDTYGDCINAESYLEILSGCLTLAAGDDAIHSDYDLYLGQAGGNNEDLDVNIGSSASKTGSCEGIEGANIYINSGDYDLYCTDDCINAANSDLKNYQFTLVVNGDDIYAVSTNDGDTFDSNGSITINGGNIVVYGGSNGGNAIDTGTDGNSSINDDLIINGGTVFGAGASNMSVVPTSAKVDWVAWGSSGNGGPGGGSGFNPGMRNAGPGGNSSGFGENINDFGGNSTASTNMSDASAIKLTVGSTSYSVGSSVNISAGSTLTVSNGSTTLLTETAQQAATFAFYAGDLSNTQSSETDNTAAPTNNDTATPEESTSTPDSTASSAPDAFEVPSVSKAPKTSNVPGKVTEAPAADSTVAPTTTDTTATTTAPASSDTTSTTEAPASNDTTTTTTSPASSDTMVTTAAPNTTATAAPGNAGTKATASPTADSDDEASAGSAASTKPAQVKNITLKNHKSGKIICKYKKISGAKGYQIWYSTKKNGKNAIKKLTASTSYTIKDLKKGQTCYVKVRAYTVDSDGNTMYGKWSQTKHLKLVR